MEQIGDRILIKQLDKEVTAIIRAAGKKDRKKILMLKWWVIVWGICGLLMFTVFFLDTTSKLKLYVLVFLAFWGYYFYKTAYAYYFRRYGNEVAFIQNKKLMLRRDVYGKQGTPRFYQIKEANPFRLIVDKPGALKAIAGNSFWNIYGGAIGFGKKSKPFRFGLQLPEKDAKALIKVFNYYANTK